MPQTNLSQAEIQKLNYERYYYPCPIVQKRLQAVYMKATTKMPDKKIGALAGLSRKSISHWMKRYRQDGFDALCQSNYGTNKSGLEDHAENILSSLAQRPPMNVNEAKARIEAKAGISRSPTQIRAFMKRHGLRYHKTGHIPAKADVAGQRQWVGEVLGPAIKEVENGDCHLLFMDAAHFILQPFICALWCVARLFVKASSGRHRINVLGAVDAITKKVAILSNTSYITAETIVDFLKQLREIYSGLPIKIVLDNARYQHCRLVMDTAKALEITLLFLPSYSPNLNIIERLWKFTKKTILYGKYYDKPHKFHTAITGFFESINQKYYKDLEKLLTLNFQFFESENAKIYAL